LLSQKATEEYNTFSQ